MLFCPHLKPCPMKIFLHAVFMGALRTKMRPSMPSSGSGQLKKLTLVYQWWSLQHFLLCLTSMMVQAPLTQSYKSLELSQEHTVCGRAKNLITTGFGIHGGRARKVKKEDGNSFTTSRKDI